MIPAIFVKYGICSFFILIIANHHIVASCNDFSRDILRVYALYLYFHIAYLCAARAGNEIRMITKCYEWSCFCSAISDCDGEVDACKKLFYFLVQAGSTNNYLIHIASEYIFYRIEYSLFYALVYHRHIHKQVNRFTFDKWEYLFSYYLFNNEWYGNDNRRLYFCECLLYKRRTWQTCEKI